AYSAVEDAFTIAEKMNAREVEAIHIFAGTLAGRSISLLFTRLGLTFDKIKDPLRRKLRSLPTGKTYFGQKAQEIIAAALKNACYYQRPKLGAIELFLAAYENDEFLQELLFSLDVEEQELKNAVMWIRINEQLRERYLEFRKAASFKPTGNMNRAYTAAATPLLDRISRDLTRYAVYGRLPMLVGRDKELNNIFRAVEGGGKSVVLVGEDGVGKTAIIAGIAEKMAAEDVPEILKDKRLVEISIPHIISSSTNPQESLLAVLQEIGRSGNIVAVIENIDQLVNTGSGIDLASVLSTELDKGYTFVISTCTPQKYSSTLEQSVLGRQLEAIKVEEPSRDEAIIILESKIGAIENKNKVVFTYEALAAMVDLSDRYMRESMLPAKAILIAEEVAHMVAKKGKEWALVAKNDVAAIISEKTGVPVTNVEQKESEKLLNLEDRIHERIVGQDEAVNAVAAALRRARVELRSDNRPIANFLFLGPTGVGKTELAKTTAEVYFGSEDAMLRFDMSEYQDKASVERLIGGAGEPGLLTEAVRKKPFALLLLDELEKAHPDILNLFLQVMDDGRLTDGMGRTVDFTNVILIATSNAGTQYIQDAVQRGENVEQIKQALLENELKQVYRPEFLNRFDGIIVFKPLQPEDVVAIAYLLIQKVAKRLEAKGINFEATDEAVHELAQKGYDPKYGARPLRRVIQETVDNAIAKFLLQGKVGRRDTLILNPGGKIT
ncbi:ATP-dependent Clp protease ATP-binding subunit, partial [Candidatus Parcubacteria bacterium]